MLNKHYLSKTSLNLRADKVTIPYTVEEYDMDNGLLKSFLMFSAAMITSSTINSIKVKNIPLEIKTVIKNNFNDKILRTIAAVESNGGNNLKHPIMENGLNIGQSAMGSYGLMPITVREVIKKNTILNKKYQYLLNLSLDDLYSELEKHPKIQYEIASSHLERLTKIFGNNPKLIGYAWLQGVEGTKKAIKDGKDIDNHWHIKKFMREYNKNRYIM